MLFFGSGSKDESFGAVVDIGSGSVLISIVHSDTKLDHPTVIWSYRENAPLKNINSLEESLRSILTSLLNASMRLDSEGRKVLEAYRKGGKITQVQFGAAAPWSYSVSKTINYEQEESFEVTNDLIEDLIESTKKKIEQSLKDDPKLEENGLIPVLSTTMDVLSNGYRVERPQGQTSNQLNISHANVVFNKKLVAGIDVTADKLFADVEVKKISFMLMFYSVVQDLLPQTYDSCLIDITDEATEIGIMRNGVLTYCTHTPFGFYSLAREISAITKVPLQESLGYLYAEKPFAFKSKLNDGQKESVEAVFEAYINKLTLLFHETGDKLSIPKHISLHCELKAENLFVELIEKAVKRSIKTQPFIVSISKKIIDKAYEANAEGADVVIPTNTALLVSTQFFHKQQEFKKYEYL